jgi:cytochrome P450
MTQSLQPPLVKGLPVIGSLIPLLNDSINFLFGEYRRLGPIFRVRVLGKELKVLAGPELNLLMASDLDALSSVEVWEPFVQNLGAQKILNTMEGEPHVRLRRLMQESFSRSTVSNNTATIVNMIHAALGRYSEGQSIPLVRFLQELVAAELGLITTYQEPGEYFDDIMVYWTTMIYVLFGNRPRSLMETPSFRRARQRVEEFMNQIVESRRSLPREKRDPDNFIDNLLTVHESDPDFLSDRELLVSTLTPYIAGIDTAANITSFLIYELLRHPDLFEQCRQEADQIFADGIPNPARLRNMPTLHAAIMETLRLYPLAGVLRRFAGKDFEFAGYSVKKGEPLLVATGAAHYDPRYFPNPKTFDIGRFSPPRNEHKVKGAYAPFGAGPHTCLGAPLAEAQIALTIATILHSVDFSLVNPNYKLKIVSEPGMTAKGLAIKIDRWRNKAISGKEFTP